MIPKRFGEVAQVSLGILDRDGHFYFLELGDDVLCLFFFWRQFFFLGFLKLKTENGMFSFFNQQSSNNIGDQWITTR